MFKAQVLRRSFSLWNRVPTSRIVRSAARDGHESVTIHRVRIQKPFLSRQRLVGAVAITTAIYGLGHYLGIEVEVQEEGVKEKKPGRWKKQIRNEDGSLGEVDDQEANEEGNEENHDGEGDDEEEYDDAILFLPTGLSRPKPLTYYKGSDPEWQEFKRISQDRAKVDKIRQDLVNIVRTMCTLPEYAAVIGPVDHSKGRVWIEFKFPDGPPIEFERPGYELTEDLEWRKTTQDVDATHHVRIMRLLQPTATATALYKDTKRKVGQAWNNLSVYMGWTEKIEPLTVQQVMQQTKNPSTPSPPAVSSTAASSVSPFGTLPGASQRPAAQSPSSGAGSEKELGFVLPDPKSLTLDLGQFRQDLRRKVAPVPHMPRGCFLTKALIEVHGEKARVTFNLQAVYDPKFGRYVTVTPSVWNFSKHRQAPKGGR
ncbi:hypothetical protein G6514_008219 [Epicoccum nigrum]|nr:hypothetical protein G6514_008219 [Epicoccum nigrum]